MKIELICTLNHIANDTYEDLGKFETLPDPNLEALVQRMSEIADQISSITHELMDDHECTTLWDEIRKKRRLGIED